MFTSALRSDAIDIRAAADLPASVRVDARLELAVERVEKETRFSHRHESGAFRLRFPRAHGAPPEAVIVNIAGGLAGGDRVATDIRVGEGAAMALSSAAAERVYRSAGDATRLTSRLRLARGASLLWLPQETILHDRSAAERRFEIDLAEESRLVLAEMLYFGRRASGERFERGALRESWRVRHSGRLVLAEETRMAGDGCSPYAHPAALGQHVAMATMIFAQADAGEALEAIRARLGGDDTFESGATDLGPLVLVRLLSPDAARLRRIVLDLATFLAGCVGQPMPRALLN